MQLRIAPRFPCVSQRDGKLERHDSFTRAYSSPVSLRLVSQNKQVKEEVTLILRDVQERRKEPRRQEEQTGVALLLFLHPWVISTNGWRLIARSLSWPTAVGIPSSCPHLSALIRRKKKVSRFSYTRFPLSLLLLSPVESVRVERERVKRTKQTKKKQRNCPVLSASLNSHQPRTFRKRTNHATCNYFRGSAKRFRLYERAVSFNRAIRTQRRSAEIDV